MGTTTHTNVFDAATDAELQRLEDDAAAAAADLPDRKRWYLSIIVLERKSNDGWDIIVSHTTKEGDEDKTTRVCLSRDDVARTIAQELENAN